MINSLFLIFIMLLLSSCGVKVKVISLISTAKNLLSSQASNKVILKDLWADEFNLMSDKKNFHETDQIFVKKWKR